MGQTDGRTVDERQTDALWLLLDAASVKRSNLLVSFIGLTAFNYIV